MSAGTFPDNTIFGTNDRDTISGTGDNDLIYAEKGDDTVTSGAGDDTVYGGYGADSVLGGAGSDLLYGGTGHDTLGGGDGSDSVYGGDGNDAAEGGFGDDLVLGGSGNDLLFGGRGNDTIDGGLNSDTVFGGEGADLLVFATTGGKGARDTYDGESGVDTIRLAMTAAQAANAAFQAELSAYQAFLAVNADPDAASGASFTFATLGLTLRNFEHVELVVDSSFNSGPRGQEDRASATDGGPAVIGNVLSNDVDTDLLDVLRVSSVARADASVGLPVRGLYGTLVLNADGSYTYTLDPASPALRALGAGQTASEIFAYGLTDGTRFATSQLVITVTGTNDGPVVTSAPVNLVLDEANAPLSASGAIVFSDADAGDMPTAAYDPATGAAISATGVVLDAAQRSALEAAFSVTPAGDWTFNLPSPDFLAEGEEITVVYGVTVTDAAGATTGTTVTLHIRGSNDGPEVVAAAGDSAGTTLAETDAPLSATGTLTVQDPDVSDTVSVEVTGVQVVGPRGDLSDADVLAMFVVSPGLAVPASATHGLIDWTFSSGAEAFGFLAEGETLTLRFSIRPDDGQGGGDNGIGVVTIHITGTNDAPVVAAALEAAVDEDGAGAFLDLLTGATDADAGATFAVTGLGALPAGLTLLPDGRTIAIDPADAAFQDLAIGEVRVLTLTYGVTDDRGATVPQTATVTVTGTNDGPSLAAGHLAAVEDGAGVTLDLATLGDDIDSDDDGATLGYAIIGAPGEGSATLAGSVLTFDPGAAFQDLAAGETRDVTVEIRALDSHVIGAVNVVTVTVTGVNDDPDAVADTASVDESDIIVVDPDGVLGNDTDADASDHLSVTAVNGIAALAGTQVAGTQGGLFTVNADGSWSFVTNGAFESLAAGQSVTTSVTYTAGDGRSEDTTTLEVVVRGRNDGPVAQADTFSVAENATLSGNLLADNGSGADFDIDAGDSLAVTAINGIALVAGAQITLASGAKLVVGADGTFTYDPAGAVNPAQGASIADSFTYTIADESGATATATATIGVTGINDVPVVVSDSVTFSGVSPTSGAAGGIGAAGGTGGGSFAGTATLTGRSYLGAGGNDTISLLASSTTGRGGAGGGGGPGASAAQSGSFGPGGNGSASNPWTYIYSYSGAGAGGTGGQGGLAGTATAVLSACSVEVLAGADTVSLRAVATGGAGGGGGFGGGSVGGPTGIDYHHDANGYYYRLDHRGGLAGPAGDGGAGGRGADADARVANNLVAGSGAGDGLFLQAVATGGAGGSGGSGGSGGGDPPGAAVFTGGRGGAGGTGGTGTALVTGGTVDGGDGNDTITIQAASRGGSGGAGGGGGNGGHIHFTDPVGNYASTEFLYTFGQGGAGGAGGRGGDATATLSSVTATGGTGDDTITLAVQATAGSAGAGGGSNAGYSFVGTGYSYVAGTAGASGASGTAGAASIVITGCIVDGGDGNDTLRIDVAGSAGLAISIGGNVLAGGAGTDTLDLTALRFSAASIDLSAGFLQVGAGTSSLSGIEAVRGTGGNDILRGASGAESLWGGSGDDTIDGRGGDDVLRGDAGLDVFVLRVGDGTDTVADFTNGQDRIGLASGLAFTDLTIRAGSGGTELVVTASGEVLALLAGVSPALLDAGDFLSV